jgi:hypothetical protein
MKPRIFIGSSTEGIKTAEYIKIYLSSEFECFLWTDEVFKFNDGFLETLLKEASAFDFGILVFTKDDHTVSRGKGFETARDNVLFEYGLFLGRLGPSRAYIIHDNEVHIPSDLSGITLCKFDSNPDISKSATLNEELEKLKKQILEKVGLGFLGLLPSTAIAIGYFYNFVQSVCDTLASLPDIIIKDQTFKKYKFNIVIPKDFDSDIKKRAMNYFRKKGLEPYALPTKGRAYPLYVSIDKELSDVLVLHDMPTTLNSIDKAIELYIRKGFVGKSFEEILLEDREKSNFVSVLKHLVLNDSYCKEYVEILDEE